MTYEKRNLMDSDSRLVMFVDKDPDGMSAYDVVTYARFKYDLSEDQVDSIKDEAENIEYEGFDTFDDWVEAVLDSAMEHECWKNDKGNHWEFWSPFPCLEIEV